MSQSNSLLDEMDGHSPVTTSSGTGSVALSTAMATTMPTKRGVVEDQPDSCSPVNGTANEEGTRSASGTVASSSNWGSACNNIVLIKGVSSFQW